MVLLHARKGGSGGGGSKKEEEVVLPGRANTGMRLGKYELGRTLGEGNFGKVKYARNLESGQPFAIKILEKNRILDLKITDQIKREIGTLKLLKHPNVVRLYEVLASKAKIYMVLEYVNGGELFERIASKGKFTEAKGRKLFQQLIDGVSYCHNKGVFHRDLKLENVLIDASGNIKITDFGLSALPQHLRDDGLLHTTCGSPNYVAPEILSNKGTLSEDFQGRGSDTKVVISRSQKPNKEDSRSQPHTRITIGEIKENDWFKQDYTPLDPMEEEEEEINACNDDEVSSINETPSDGERDPDSPTLINAFQLIGMSSCLDLSGFFEKEDVSERKIRFTSHHSPKELLERIENTVMQMGFHVQKKNGKLKVMQERKGQKAPGCLSVAAEVFEISPSLYVVELQKAYGDPLVYRQLCNRLSNELGVSRSQEHLETADL
ncbi:UNVERIFIED_CONTAM: CBL-interacting serine/threonine-protein kinase [Sesamum calycinum]|uniref:non-specific serine/threonine protein kinase n=1 Tax=Sesamum calycinum TaxID=2727403 RepID=A0AAW2QJN4_9LAMI